MEIRDVNVKSAYNKVQEKIILSEPYVSFIIKNIIDNKNLESKMKEYFLDESGSFQSDKFYEFIKDIKYMEMLSCILGIEDEFYEATIKSAKDNNIYDTIVNTKLLETMYGNPKKEDFTSNDVAFSILESIFGLDVILKSMTDKNVLKYKFSELLNNSSDFNITSLKDYDIHIEQFFNEFEEFYKNTSDIKKYEDIKEYVKDNCNGLKPFIQAGLSSHVRKVVWGEKDSYKEYDSLAEEIFDLFTPRVK